MTTTTTTASDADRVAPTKGLMEILRAADDAGFLPIENCSAVGGVSGSGGSATQADARTTSVASLSAGLEDNGKNSQGGGGGAHPRLAFPGGFLAGPGGKPLDSLDEVVGPFLRQGTLAATLFWAISLSIVYEYTPVHHYEWLSWTELSTNGIVLVLLVYTNASRMMQLFVRDKSFVFVNTGVMVGSVTVQAISTVSLVLMMIFPTPVIVDPVTGIRSHLVRWVEWVSVAFLMTFLTESINMPLGGKGGTRIAWFHGIAIALSTSAGAILAFCQNWTWWLSVFTISWILFSSLFIRLYQRHRVLSRMPTGGTLENQEAYDRARLSFKTITICTIAWTGLAVSWSLIALLSPYAPKGSIFASDALVLVTENFFEAISKVFYCGLLIEIHNSVFDDATRTKRRLEELRKFMSTVWETSSDVMIWCSWEQEGSISAIVSPAFFKVGMDNLDPKGNKDNDNDKIPDSTLLLEMDPSKKESFRAFSLSLSSPISREEAINVINFSSSDGESNCRLPATGGCNEKNARVIADILHEAYHYRTQDSVVMKDLYGKTATDEEFKLRYEAKITNQQKSCFIVLRDISERYQRFETEKKLVEEITARKKDAEANRFTRHEVKNGILAAIGLLESMKGLQRIPSLRGKLEKTHSDNSLVGTRYTPDAAGAAGGGGSSQDLASAQLSISSDADTGYVQECVSELDSTLRNILDTITDHAMSREVIYEEYQVAKERVIVPDVLSNIRRQVNSSDTRFSLRSTTPEKFPSLGMDPRLLRYIYQNALSNACRYGSTDGDVETSISYDAEKRIFHMEVTNEPGFDHERLLNMSREEVRACVFAPGTSLHTPTDPNQDLVYVSNSSGDGAWIMQKCARILKGDCDIHFQHDRTVFSFWCPAKAYGGPSNQAGQADTPELTGLGESTWGIVIDDSKIQRKLMDRFLKIAGIAKDRRVIVGSNSEEIHGFVGQVVDLIESNPSDKFLVIADENLDIVEGPALHGTVSGSKCLQKLLQRLDKDVDECRVLALVRSANDSASDVEKYKYRAHGYLPKAPIDKAGVLNSIKPWWFKRFPNEANIGRPSMIRTPSSNSFEDSAMYDAFSDIKRSLEVIDALCRTEEIKSLQKRWRPIQERLHALKGDIKTIVPTTGGKVIDDGIGRQSVLETIDTLCRGEFPDNLRLIWARLRVDITSVLDAHR